MASLVNAPSVIFLDVLDHYCCNKDLPFKLKFDGGYTVYDTDEVAILKLGWSNKSEAFVKKPVEKVSEDGICCMSFKSDELPRECINLYQICYFRGQDLQGASSPFDFCDFEIPTLESFMSRISHSFESINIYQNDQGKNNEISNLKEQNASLKEENEILRKSLTVLVNDKLEKQEKGKCETQIAELKNLFQTLQATVQANGADIKMLKKKIVEGGEEYKKLYLEKYKLEKKYDRVVSAFRKGQSQHKSNTPEDEICFDISNLPSLPQISSLLDD